MTSLNERAWALVEGALANADHLGITSQLLESGSLVVDMGVRAPGGLSAGLAMAAIGMAGLGESHLEMADLLGKPWPWVMTSSDHPLVGCYLSQAAHWPVQVGKYRAMGSGPACLLNQALDPGKRFGLHEEAACAVLVLEAATLPDDSVCQQLADCCAVSPGRLALLVAPTASLAGAAQVAARTIETALHKLDRLGFDLRHVMSGTGRCPLAAPAGDETSAMGRVNDAIMFGSQVWLAVRGEEDARLQELVAKVPASASLSYGEPFLETLSKAGGFYNVDPGLFAPAEITLASLDSGRVFHAGGLDLEKLSAVYNE